MFRFLFDNTRKQTATIVSATAILGVLNGYGVFSLWREEADKHTGALRFLVALFLAAIMALIFELLRPLIQEHREIWSWRRVTSSVLMLAVFELFALAWHNTAERGWRDYVGLAGAVFGDAFAENISGGWNLAALGALWIGVSLTIALSLRALMWLLSEKHRLGPHSDGTQSSVSRRESVMQGLSAGLKAGVLLAPGCGLSYVLLFRAYFLAKWAQSRPVEWDHFVGGLSYGPAHIPLHIIGFLVKHAGPVGFFVGIAILVCAVWLLKDRGGIVLGACVVALLWILWTLISVKGQDAKTLTTNSWAMLKLVSDFCFMAAVIWGVPSILLGMCAPLLRRPSEIPGIWGVIAFCAAAALALVTYFRLHAGGASAGEKGLLLGGTFLLFAAGIAFSLGVWAEELWALLALSIGILTGSGVQAAARIDLLVMQERARDLIAMPLNVPEETLRKGGAGLLSFERELDLLAPRADRRQRLENIRTRLGPLKQDSRDVLLRLSELEGRPQDTQSLSRAHALSDETKKLSVALHLLRYEIEGKAQLGGEADRSQAQLLADLDEADSEVRDVVKSLSRADERWWNRQIQPTREELTRLEAAVEKQENEPVSVQLDQIRRLIESNKGVSSDVAKLRDPILIWEKNERSGELEALETRSRHLGQALKKRLRSLQRSMARDLEMSMTSCMGFWITIGMLASWSLIRSEDRPSSGLAR